MKIKDQFWCLYASIPAYIENVIPSYTILYIQPSSFSSYRTDTRLSSLRRVHILRSLNRCWDVKIWCIGTVPRNTRPSSDRASFIWTIVSFSRSSRRGSSPRSFTTLDVGSAFGVGVGAMISIASTRPFCAANSSGVILTSAACFCICLMRLAKSGLFPTICSQYY